MSTKDTNVKLLSSFCLLLITKSQDTPDIWLAIHAYLWEIFPARPVPHSAVYAASALPMELPKNFHGQSALKVQNDIHKWKKSCCISAAQNPLLPHLSGQSYATG
jgi:hypothetical protein